MHVLFKHRLFIIGRKNVASLLFAWKYRRMLLATVEQPALKLDYFLLVHKATFGSLTC